MSDVQEVTVALDSNGKELEAGDSVHVALSLTQSEFNYSTFTVKLGRDLDFGTVENVNDDGTVQVFWDAAGCSCTDPDGRKENASDLTKADDYAYDLFNASLHEGQKQGREAVRSELADALGFADNTEELTELRKAVEALQAKNN
jgi:hypothetical protein